MTESVVKRESIVKRFFKAPHIYWGLANTCYGIAAQTPIAIIGACIFALGSLINVAWGLARPLDPNRSEAKNRAVRFMDRACSNPAFYMIFAACNLGVIYAPNYTYNAVQAYRQAAQGLPINNIETQKTHGQIIQYNSCMAAGTGLMATGNGFMVNSLLIAARRKREGR